MTEANSLSERQTKLSPAKQALLEKWMRGEFAADRPAIPRRTEQGPVPLSFAQQRLWFLDQLLPGSPAYNIPTAIRLTGRLNVAVLQQSLDEIVRRHEVLRTTFPTVDGEAVQVIAPSLTWPLPVVDLQECSEATRETLTLQLAAEEAQRPFNLAHGPLLRATLLRSSEQEHVFLLTMHHIVSDGWSIGVFIREMSVLYDAFAVGQPSLLPELPIQYADFALWQREWLQGERLENQLTYWKQQLGDGPSALELPGDRPRPAIQTFRGARQPFELALSLSRALSALSQQEGVTLFMMLLAAFKTLLYRYTGQEDVLVGSPIANRNRTEIEGLIGLFVNTLVVRTNLAGNPTFRELLGRVRSVTSGAYAHQDLPFEQLIGELQPQRDLSRNPLFQVMFVLQNTPRPTMTRSDLTLSPLESRSGTAQFDLRLSMEEDGDGLGGLCEYSTEIFDAATINHLLNHFRALLMAIAADPEQRLSDLALLMTGERQQLLDDWNSTLTDYSQMRQQGLHHLIAEQVAQTSDATALVFENHHLTYQELGRRANQLAHYLQALGVGSESLVGISAERSLEMVIGLLGILKAGGAYVPLDPTYPRERLAFMLADAQVPVLLTQQRLVQDLPAHAAEVVCLDTGWDLISQSSEAAPANGATADSLAYAIYTSGSTGRPKGAMNTHRGICNRLLWMQEAYRLTPADRVLQKTPFSFDVSVWEFFWPLLTGACLVVARPEGHKDSAYLVELIVEQHVTTMHFVPSMLQLFVEERNVGACQSLKRVICSGEALPFDLQTRFYARLGAELHNLYGPTEAAVDVTFWACEREDDRRTVPIGRPIANTRIYLLDAQLRPVPVGMPGELHIGGVGLARGYLERAGLTAARFTPYPFSDQPGARLYKTGDLARYRSDGSIEFLGRIDFQVKVRGFRIELGEIEAMLNQHPTVRETVVTVHQDGFSDQRLVAYLVPSQAQPPATDELRRFLQTRLPEYMVPAAFVMLEALPLTPSGKVDRRALPAPDHDRVRSAVEFVAPRTEAEAQIATIWRQVLGIETVGIDDNFFDLGGESFKAIRAVRKIGESVSVIALFQHPTIRELAAYLAQGQPKREGILLELTRPFPAQDRVISLVCVPYAGGSAITYQPLARALPKNYSLYAVEIPGHDYSQRDEALQSIKKVARRCVQEIQRDLAGPIALYGHCLGGALTMEIAHLLEEVGIEPVGIFLGGHFPTPRLPGKLFDWLTRIFPTDRRLSNQGYYEFLRGLGGFADVIDPEEQEFVIRNVRHDAREAEDYYTQAYATPNGYRLKAPILCIVGDMDWLTEFHEERVTEWKFFSDAVDLVVLRQAGHYFVKHRTAELAQIIPGQLAAWQDDTSRAPHPVQKATKRERRAGQAAAPKKQAFAPSLLTFFIIAFGQFISMTGSGLTFFAMGVWLYERTGSVSDLGAIAVFTLLPGILVSPVAGAVVDRWDRRWIMILSDTLSACATLVLALLLWQDSLQTWHIVAMASVGSIADAFQRPSYAAAIAQLVPKRYLGSANGIVQFGQASSRLLAPFFGGILVMLIGLHGIVLIDFATFLFAVATLLFVRFPNVLFRKQEGPLLQEVIKGWRFIAKRRGMVAMVVFFMGTNYFIGLFNVLNTPLVLSFATPAVLGTIMAANGVGVLVGGLVMSLWGGTRRRAEGMVGFFILFGLSAMIMGARPLPIFPTIGLFGLGFSLAVANAHWLTIIQTKVGFELQGRVLSTNQMLSWLTIPLGHITAGPLADKVFEPLMAGSSPLAVAVSRLIGFGSGRGMGLLTVLAGLLVLAWSVLSYRYRPLRLMEDELPDAIPDAVIVADRDALQELADRQLLVETT